jgi:tRNA(Ile)-lysidine synthase
MIDPQGIKTDLLPRVRLAVEEEGLLRGVETLLVACSGGGDSVAMLELLVRLAEETGTKLVVAHLDHGQRGEQGRADAEYTRALAARHGLDATIAHEAASQERLSEAELRGLRHDFFARALSSTHAGAVALGHTLDDQAETVLFNLARGAARPGLAGMRPRREVDGVLLVRPLLRIRRHELREYLTDCGVEWREDPSNDDLGYTRNLLRHRTVKDLEEAVPGAVSNIGRAAALLQLEETWIAEIVREAYAATVVEEEPGRMIALDTERLGSAPRALQTRIVREAICGLRGSLRGLSREHVDAVLDEVLTGVESARDLPGVRVRRGESTLQFLPLSGRRLKHPGARTES